MIDIRHEIEKQRTLSDPGIMQYPDELYPFMQFMVDNDVKSYLEIGVKRGHMPIFIKKVLGIPKVYACDINYPEQFKEHNPDIEFLQADSNSKKYAKWRKKIGHIDMVLIDADHDYKPAKRDYLREVSFPHRFIAMHDIANSGYPKLTKLWRNTIKGDKIEFVNKDPNARLLCVEHKDKSYIANYRRKYGTSCGIGICFQNN
jgi:predicted O-methyltransferase YrrM